MCRQCAFTAVVLVTAVLQCVCLVNARSAASPRSSSSSSSSSSPDDTRVNQLVGVEELSQTWFRGGKTEPLPERLGVSFQVQGRPMQLSLRKNKRINLDNIPVTFANSRTHIESRSQQNVAFYQDPATGAVVSVTSTEEDGQVVHKYSGSFEMGKERYGIEPQSMESGVAMVADILGGQPEHKKENKYNIYKVQDLSGETKYKQPSNTTDDYVDYERVTNIVEEGRYRKRRDEGLGNRETKRQKRASKIASYHVEVLFVLDHTVWEKWMEHANGDEEEALASLKYYYGNVFNGMDMAYSSWDVERWGFSITPFLQGFYIAQTASEAWWTVESITNKGSTFRETAIAHDVALDKVGEFVSMDGRNWSNPDHGMFWTRYDIDGNSAVGYAYIEGICRGKQGVSIMEENGFNSWSTAAHELGHNLGARHDGDKNDCDSADQYIMESKGGRVTTDLLKNTFTFSDCSLESFRDVLDGTEDEYPRVCLTDRVCEHGSDTDIPDESDQLPGEKYSADEQCKIIHGSNSHNCHDNDEDICFTLFCQSEYKGDWNCWGRSPGAADGTTCGTGKWCIRGQCVEKTGNTAASAVSTCKPSSLPSTVPDGCVDERNWYGRINDVRHNCQELVANYPQFCFSWSSAIRGCCATCAEAGLVEPTQHLVEPMDGGWTDWSDWGQCSVTCETGTQVRIRSCTDPAPQDGGEDCSGDSTQSRSCDEGSCSAPPVDGKWSSWESWSSCPVTCGSGTRYRERSCDNPRPKNGGESCPGSREQSKSCDAGDCPVDGRWGSWSSWSDCSVTCGRGSRSRSRECNNPRPQNGGDDCSGSDSETKTCGEDEICRGTWTSWGSWGACSVTCGTGREYRTRSCIGENCVGSGQRRRDCNPGDCPVHGNWGRWGSWSSCSADCGAGTQTRQRECDDPSPANGGNPCEGDEEMSQYCIAGSCRVDGEWGSWSAWSPCSTTCGDGTQSRSRDCDSPMAANGGTECEGDDREAQTCKGDCLGPWLPWEDWGPCSVTCGSGTRARSRECEEENSCTGQSTETSVCSEQDCGTSAAEDVHTPRVALLVLHAVLFCLVLCHVSW